MTTGSPPQENTGTSNEAERPRYYILGDDGFEARFDFVNEDKVLIDRQRGDSEVISLGAESRRRISPKRMTGDGLRWPVPVGSASPAVDVARRRGWRTQLVSWA